MELLYLLPLPPVTAPTLLLFRTLAVLKCSEAIVSSSALSPKQHMSSSKRLR